MRCVYFLMTIDTEADNGWAREKELTTKNAKFLPRFQELCESYGFKPTYLTTYEMALDPFFQEFGRDVITRRQGEIGAHLHAWSSPPLVPLTDADYRFLPYITEYPDYLVRQKTAYLTSVLEETFQVDMVSHRGGRWGFNAVSARALVENGYRVDCSVFPHMSLRRNPGAPAGNGGPDFTSFPNRPYFVDLDDISRPGDSCLLEVPLTVRRSKSVFNNAIHAVLDRLYPMYKVLRRFSLNIHALMPNGHNLDSMLWLVKEAVAEGCDCVEFMLHSSELMPGGSSHFADKRSIDALYENLEGLFAVAKMLCDGATLAEYFQHVSAGEMQVLLPNSEQRQL